MNNDTHERSLLGKRTKSAEQEHLIKLYAIVANGKIIERHLVERKNKCVLENLVEHICKKVKGNSSTVVKSVQFEGYHVYYFEQDTFLFLLATQTAQVHSFGYSVRCACKTIYGLLPIFSTKTTTRLSLTTFWRRSLYAIGYTERDQPHRDQLQVAGYGGLTRRAYRGDFQGEQAQTE